MAHGSDFLVSAQWLREHRDDPGLVVVDTRSTDDYWKGHLEGARHFDPFPFHSYDTGAHGQAEFRAQLKWIFSTLGITTRHTVVFYENDSGMCAVRATWALEWMGHRGAKILDGGLKALGGEGLVTEVAPYSPALFDGTPRDDSAANLAYVVERIGRPGFQIFDVRSDAEYYSERVRAKHGGAVPGAIHQDWTATKDGAGAFRPPEELRAGFERLGLDPAAEIITYCQGGYRAAHVYFALRLAGYRNVRNYWASWVEWGNRDDVPIEYPRRRATP
jgi:thiosulfate/3-mercaptopyruvate sulfurtransferase